jgi:hypothetical protein
MRNFNRYLGVTMLTCTVAACGGGNKDAVPEQAPAPQQVVPPAPEPPAAEPPAKAATVAPPDAAPAGPAPEVVVNGVRTNGDAAVLADFQKRVGDYVALKKSVDKKTPDQKETREPIQIETTQKLLAAKIISLRKGARAGDIFTEPVRLKFRQLLTPEVKGTTGAETKQELNEDFEEGGKEAGNPKAALRVNVEYPEGTPLATTPPNVLQALPRLPDGLEYRFIGKNLIIRDADANVVVDVMPNAIR